MRTEERGAGAAIAEVDGFAGRTFRKIVDWIVKLLYPVAVVALMMGTARIFLDLGTVWRSPSIARGFDVLVSDLLSMFVVIELLRSIVEYFEVHRLKIVFIVDAALVFLLREVMIDLYQNKVEAAQVAALAGLLAVLGGFRIAAVHYAPEEGTSHAIR
jgi:uncharacterized membrane protein (DUF373 family)